jgi:phage FluMu gp28-like protein
MSGNIKLYKPYSKQREVHTALNDKDTTFIVVKAGRQAGKSLLAINQALMWALSKSDRIVYWVSPTASQASKIYKQLTTPLMQTDLITRYRGGQGDTEVVFSNGSIIKFRSAAQEDSLRGESIDYLIVDEAAFVKESVFQEILLPMLNVRGKKCLFISTPKGKNYFYYQFLKGQGEHTDYKSFEFISSDNPHSNNSIIQMAKDSLPDVLFKQEYLAQFVDNAAVFENIDELACMTQIEAPVSTDKYYIGVDIGMKNDYTVVTILNQRYELIHMDRFTDITAPELKLRLIKTFDTFKPTKIYIELNNQGMPIYDDLKAMGVRNLQGFNTTSTSKNEIINNLINLFASKKIKVLNNNVVKTELEAFTMTVSPTGKAKFAGANGFHDDIPMSLAIGVECLNKNVYSGKIVFL